MPFRRKHRNPLFGSFRSGADKENTHDGAGATEQQQQQLGAAAATMQLQIPLNLSLVRCQSDTSQRTCSDMNPNNLRRSSSQTKNRHGDRFSASKESNLQLLNSTLVREVTSLRASNHTMASEKEELENEVTNLVVSKKEAAEKLDAAEERLQSLGLVVDKLQYTNGVLAEEAARLREDTNRFAEEKQALLADLEKVTVEKSLLEELLETVRASGNAFREEMQQALLQADMEKKALAEEKKTLMQEKQELQLEKEKLSEEVTKLGSDMSALLLEKANTMEDMARLEGEVSRKANEKQELEEQLSSKKQALAAAHENLVKEKVRMLSEKTELELSIRCLRVDHEEVMKEMEIENEAIKSCVESLKSNVQHLEMQNRKLSDERDGFMQEVDNLRTKLCLTEKEAIDAQNLFDMRFEEVAKEKDNLVSKFRLDLEEARSQARMKEEEALALRNKLQESSKQKSALQAVVKAGTQKQDSMEAHIQTLKGNLIVAEGAASEAQKRAKAVEKDAAIMMDRRTREMSQKIGALESRLAEMVERQGEMEVALRGKEEALKAAITAEREAKEKVDAAWAKGKSIGGKLDQLRCEYTVIQSRAMAGTQKITSLQDELSELGADGVVADNGGRRLGRGSRRKAAARKIYQPKVCHQPKL